MTQGPKIVILPPTREKLIYFLVIYYEKMASTEDFLPVRGSHKQYIHLTWI